LLKRKKLSLLHIQRSFINYQCASPLYTFKHSLFLSLFYYKSSFSLLPLILDPHQKLFVPGVKEDPYSQVASVPFTVNGEIDYEGFKRKTAQLD